MPASVFELLLNIAEAGGREGISHLGWKAKQGAAPQALPQIPTLDQALGKRMGTMPDLDAALAKRFGVAMPAATAAGATEAPRNVTASLPAGPTYSEEFGMTPVGVACWPCTDRHVNTVLVTAEQGAAAASPQERQEAAATILGEVAVWRRYDLRPDKLARTEPGRRAAVEAAIPHMQAAADCLTPPPGDLHLAWAAAGEAERFLRGAPKPLDIAEATERMDDAKGWIGRADTLTLPPVAAPHLRDLRLARQRLAEEAEAGLGLTHAATLQCKDALRAAAVALTPDPGAEALQRAAEHARAARTAFRGGALGSIKARAAERTTTPPSDLSRAYLDAAAISDAMADRYLIPKEAGEATGPFGATAQTKQAYENLSRFAAAIDVPLRVEDLPPELENGQVAGIIKGGYFPDENSILVSPSSLTEDPQSVDTLLEELAHAIQIGPGGHCNPWKSRGLAYEDRPEEVAAKTSTLVALLEAGLPFETQYGHRIDPRTVRLDVERMRGDMDPRMLRIVNETAGVLVAAIRGDVAGAARRARTCLSV